MGGVLSQVQDGQERVISYFSKQLSKPERNYCLTRRELLAIVKSVEHFYKYLYGRNFLLRTDHAALKWLLHFKNPEGQVARWIERLQEFDFEIMHRPGTNHRNADALSRRPCPENCKHCLRLDGREAVVMRTRVIDDQWRPEQLRRDQEMDPELGPVITWKRENRRPNWQEVSALSPALKCYWAQWESLELEDGVLKRVLEGDVEGQERKQLLVPRNRVPEVLRHLHDGSSGGHFGLKKTVEKVRERFYWVNSKKDVKEWCQQCQVCVTGNGPVGKKKAPMKLYNVGSPFERIALDIAGSFPKTESGNKYILVVMDYFTKWPEAYALPNQEAVTIADVLVKQLFSRFGVPLELHSDQGRNFESELFRELCKLLCIHKTRTTPLHPQSDGMVERMNRTMGKYPSKVVSDHQRDWDQFLHLFLMAYRSAVQESTGHTPASVLLGRELRLPCDLKFGKKPGEEIAGDHYVDELRRKMDYTHQKVRENLRGASKQMKERYDIRAQEGSFQPGDLVWLHNPQRRKGLSPKLQRSWEGPYEILKRINDVIYRIKKQPRGKPKVVHFNRLAPYAGTNEEVEVE